MGLQQQMNGHEGWGAAAEPLGFSIGGQKAPLLPFPKYPTVTDPRPYPRQYFRVKCAPVQALNSTHVRGCTRSPTPASPGGLQDPSEDPPRCPEPIDPPPKRALVLGFDLQPRAGAAFAIQDFYCQNQAGQTPHCPVPRDELLREEHQ